MMADLVQGQAAEPRSAKKSPAGWRRIAGLWWPSILFCICLLALWQTMARLTASPLVPDVGDIAGYANRFEPVSEAQAQGGPGKGAGQDADQRNADLHR